LEAKSIYRIGFMPPINLGKELSGVKWKNWLENWDMMSLKIKTPFLESEWKPSEPDKDAAWNLYIELLTRITTQNLQTDHGDEKAALESIHSLFSITRQIIKDKGRGCVEFTKIAVVVLNQKVTPFTAKWHKLSIDGAFDDAQRGAEFRSELALLQNELRKYTRALADMADVEDLTSLEESN